MTLSSAASAGPWAAAQRLLGQGLAALDGERPEPAHPLAWRCFQLGLFFLASSALIAGVLLFVALLLGSRNREPWWQDRCNRWLAAAALLMLVGCFGASSGPLAWVGLGNCLRFSGLSGATSPIWPPPRPDGGWPCGWWPARCR